MTDYVRFVFRISNTKMVYLNILRDFKWMSLIKHSACLNILNSSLFLKKVNLLNKKNRLCILKSFDFSPRS